MKKYKSYKLSKSFILNIIHKDHSNIDNKDNIELLYDENEKPLVIK